MQMAVPELMVVSTTRPAHIQQMYGLDSKYEPTRIYAAQCLIARRLVERGVRFIELTCPQVGGDRWDQHGNLKKGHENNARAVDQPIAALLTDLQATRPAGRNAGRLGRRVRPHAVRPGQRTAATTTRSASPIWMAGGGVKAGHDLRRDRRMGLQGDREPRRRSTTCTPRCCTCWASITRDRPSASAAATCA